MGAANGVTRPYASLCKVGALSFLAAQLCCCEVVHAGSIINRQQPAS